MRKAGNRLDVLFLLDKAPGNRLSVDQRNFLLGCTPIVNLFQKTSEPVRLDHRSTEYRLIPDMRREDHTEIHSVLRVSTTPAAEGSGGEIDPYFSFSHRSEQSGRKAFWFARRAPSERKDLSGTETFISFVDLGFNPKLPPEQTVYARVLCTNRNTAELLPAGARFEMEDAAPLAGITCLGKPTSQLIAPLGGESVWRLISHLSLNYLSLGNDAASLDALREILRLYCFSEQPSTHRQIAGVRSMSCRSVVRRVGSGAARGFCRGTEIELLFDESLYVGSGAFLLASVLNRFFALYASVNSFTELVIKSVQREGTWKRWPPMIGQKTLL